MAKRTCRIEGCGRTHYSLTFCRSHYRAFKKYGDPLHQPPTGLERFLQFVDIHVDGCWEWTGRLNAHGYASYQVAGFCVGHRYIYELIVGPIPPGLDLDHLCRNRACVRPDHLEPVTNAENVRRGAGPTGINARKTECQHGHPLSGDNLRVRRGQRECVICVRASARERYRKRVTQRGLTP